MKIIFWIRKMITEFIFFIFVYILGILFVLSFGFLESIGLFFELFGAFLIVLLFRNYFWRYKLLKKPVQKWKEIILEFIIFFVLAQTFLVFVAPMSSLIPKKILADIGVVYLVEDSPCSNSSNEEIEKTKKLWGTQIEYKKVNAVQGGLMHNLWLLEQQEIINPGYARLASVFGNTIYFYSLIECPSEDLYFHEMTHIWQMKYSRSQLFGINTISTWVSFFYLQITNPDILYNYGGEVGLHQARQEDKHFLDFGIEQQAMIVEDWYWVNNYKNNYTSEYYELLEYYVNDMLN